LIQQVTHKRAISPVSQH